jgi:hypothetical protein
MISFIVFRGRNMIFVRLDLDISLIDGGAAGGADHRTRVEGVEVGPNKSGAVQQARDSDRASVWKRTPFGVACFFSGISS